DAVNQLVKSSDAVISTHGRLHVIVGAFTNHDSTETTYGGCRRSSRWHPLRFKRIGITGEMEQVDTLNMNAALITSLAIKKTGFLSEYFIHSGADFEYGLKIRKAGGTIWQTPNAIGFCERNSMIGRSLESGISKKERFIRLLSDKEKPARVRARYYKEYGGILWPLLWVAPYLKILVTRQRKKK
ncbi:MAG: hypothetical protein SVT56_05075, partial [Chloroflexota bacterium]|nr:hypothetical protein [Chloroflexota bacterium]